MKSFLKYYLAGYNAVAFVLWAVYFTVFIISGFELTAKGLLLLNIAQGIAVLEIIHVAVKWVKSPFFSTLAQVSSRILVLVLINVFFETAQLYWVANAGIKIVSLAWSITELVRYSFYFFSLFNKQFKWLLWCRYSFFLLLYPLGVAGEWLIIITPLVINGIVFGAYTFFVVALTLSYLYYFPVLYKYMLKQRKNKLI